MITISSSYFTEKIATDFVGPLPETRNSNKYIVTLLDDLSKYLIAAPVQSTDAETAAHELVKVILLYGPPKFLLSDNGSAYIAQLFKEVCKIIKIKKLYTAPYHCQSNFVERNHCNIESYLRIFANENKEWDELLPFYVFSYNTRISTATNYTPYEIVFERESK